MRAPWLILISLLTIVLLAGLISCGGGDGGSGEFNDNPADDDTPLITDDDDNDDNNDNDDNDIDDDDDDNDDIDDDDDTGDDDDDTFDDDTFDDDTFDDDTFDDDTGDDDTTVDLSVLMVGENHLLLGIEKDTGAILELEPDANLNIKDWYDIWFRFADEAWAVGETGFNDGAILLYRDGSFSRSYPPNVPSSNWALFSVTFPYAWRGYAVGYDFVNGTGIIMEYDRDDDEWVLETDLPAGMPEYWDARAATALLFGQVMVAGFDVSNQKGLILRKLNDTSDWEILPTPDIGRSYQLFDIALNGPNTGWAVGEGVVLKWDGTSWTDFSANVPELDNMVTLQRVECSGTFFCYAVGSDWPAGNGVIYEHQVIGWQKVDDEELNNSGDYGYPWELWGVAIGGPFDGVAVGVGQAVVIGFDGMNWEQVIPDPVSFGTRNIRSVGVNPE